MTTDFVSCRRDGCLRKVHEFAKFCGPRCAEMVRQAREAVDCLPDECVPVQHARLELSEVMAHRRIFCRTYDRCLDHAERHGWQGFSCAACPVRDELTEDERRASDARMWAAMDEVSEVA